jgi:conjugal transfer mating pair stabilization protein TraG
VIRNTIEAIVYAIFPIVVLLLLMTGGRETMMGLKNYLSVLIWIQLWPPLYAILNYMAMVHAARQLAAAASVGAGVSALSLMTSSSIYSDAISGEAVVGYMTMSIPFIAWAGLKRMETFGSALIGSVHALQSAVSSTTGSAATGSVSLGNTSMDQMAIAPTRSSAFFAGRQDDTSGNVYTSNVLGGLTAVKALANEGPVSRVVDSKVSQQHVIAANSAVTAARSESISASREKAAALSEVLMNAAARSMSHASSESSGFGSTETEGERAGALQQIAKNVSKSTGATEQQVAAVAFGGSAHLSAGIPSAAGKYLPIDGGGQISATGRKSYSASIQQHDQMISNVLSSEDKAKFKAFADTVTKNTGVIDSLVSDAKKGHELSAKLAQTVLKSERADANLRSQSEFAESISGAYQRGESVSKDIAKDPRNLRMFEELLRYERAGSAAELVKMESFIGNISSVPHQLTKNSSLPTSFSDLEREHKRNVESVSDDTISAQFKEFGSKVQRAPIGDGARGKANLNRNEQFRSDVSKTEQESGSAVEKAEADFRKKTGIEVDKNGHISTHRSLFGDANEQVRSDPDVVAEKAKELAKRLANSVQKDR